MNRLPKISNIPAEIALSVLAAFAFWASLPYQPYAASPVLKVSMMAILAFYAWRQRQLIGLTLLVALVAHGTGDVLLDVDRKALFVPAMAAFLTGHILYAVLFWPLRRPWSTWKKGDKADAIAVLILGVGLAGVLVPKLSGILAVAVPIYVAGILTMTVLAVAASWRRPWVVAGAAFYVFSDALIAIDSFLLPLDAVRYLIWPSYAAAQILIVAGYVAERKAG